MSLGIATRINIRRPLLEQHQYLSHWIGQRQYMRTLEMRLADLKTAAERTKHEIEACEKRLADLQDGDCGLSDAFVAQESARHASERSRLQQYLQELKFKAREIKIEYRTQQLNAEGGQLDNLWHDNDLYNAVLKDSLPLQQSLPPSYSLTSSQFVPLQRPASGAGVYSVASTPQPQLPPRPHTAAGTAHDSMEPLHYSGESTTPSQPVVQTRTTVSEQPQSVSSQPRLRSTTSDGTQTTDIEFMQMLGALLHATGTDTQAFARLESHWSRRNCAQFASRFIQERAEAIVTAGGGRVVRVPRGMMQFGFVSL